MVVIEIVEYKLVENVDIKKFMELSDKGMQVDFVEKQKGYISRELIKNENGVWADIIHWESMEDAQVASKNFEKSECAMKLGNFIDMESIIMKHFTVEKKY